MSTSELVYTPIDEIPKIRGDLQAGFNSGKLRSIAYRKYQLTQLVYLLNDNMERFEEALNKDLGRPQAEARLLDIASSIGEVMTQLANVDKWSKPTKPPFSLDFAPMRPIIRKEAKGTVLIISPFNYPVNLTLCPLAGAIAAGNTVLIKPSEASAATSALMTELIHKYLDNDLVRVVNGGILETTKILELQWDHIFYTGNGRVAKIVATAAAQHLTPITLELGGKSPVFVDPKCDLKMTAKRLMWGKVVNAGQTCVAPDYILVPREFQDTFVQALKEVYEEFYPDVDKRSALPGAYSRIISQQATTRIAGLLEKTQGNIAFGGKVDRETRYIEPTVVKDVKGEDSLMSEEIFGPILPIVPVDSVEDAIKFINEREHPLVVYVFSQDAQIKAQIFKGTRSGAAVANETILHTATDGLPFGGVGHSGQGMYKGKYSFDTFTHFRSSMDSPSWVDYILSFRFPPYTASTSKAALKFIRSLPKRPTGPPSIKEVKKGWGRWFILAFAVAIAGGLTSRLPKVTVSYTFEH